MFQPHMYIPENHMQILRQILQIVKKLLINKKYMAKFGDGQINIIKDLLDFNINN